MNKKALNVAICMALAFPTVSNALSLGDIESNSSLNQPFKGKINLLATSIAEAKTLRIRVAPEEVFNRVGIDRPAFLNSIQFRTTVQNGKPVILVSSNQAINEPFLNFLLEVSWPNGQLLKEYTVLLDPPVLMRPDTAIASNTAGVRAQPRRAQGTITRPAVQQRRVVQQQRRVVRAVAPARGQKTPAQLAEARRALAQRAARSASVVRRVSASSQVRSYRVKKGDNLSQVARGMAYRGIKNDQMIMALYAKNRKAFSKNNINNLKAGALLKRPSLQEVRAISSRSAKAQIIAQAREWKKSRSTAVAKRGTNGSTRVRANNAKARLEVVGSSNTIKAGNNSTSGGNASSARMNQQLALANESLTSRLKENEELKSRVSELESLLRKKNRLITLKSQQLAQLQENLSKSSADVQAKTSAQVQAPQTSINTNVAPNSQVNQMPNLNVGNDMQQQLANDRANQQGEIIRTSSEPEIGSGFDQTSEPVQNVADESTDSPFANDAETDESLDYMSLLSSPLAMSIGGGTFLALLGGFWYMRRRKDSEYGEFASIEIDDGMGSDYDDQDEQGNDEYVDDFATTAFNESTQPAEKTVEDTSEDVTQESPDDLLQEADVYIVYGLHDQAESELKQAIEKEPNNLAYRAKLIENYKAAGDKDSFEKEAKAFMALDGPDKNVYLEDINEWGKALIPGSTLFNGSSAKVAGVGAAAAAGVAMTAGMTSDKIKSNASKDVEVDDLMNSLDSSDEIVMNDSSMEELDGFSLDDVLSEPADLEFSLPLDDDDFKASGMSSTPNFAMDNSDEETESIDNFESLLALDSEEEKETEISSNKSEETIQEDSAAFETTNLNLNLDSEDFDKILPESSSYTKSEVKEELTPNLDFDTTEEVEDNLLAEFDDNLSFLDLDNGNEIEESQVNTKLDLAKAYIDMGDIEGARSTLEEVMQDGSDEQRREAEDLLHQTG